MGRPTWRAGVRIVRRPAVVIPVLILGLTGAATFALGHEALDAIEQVERSHTISRLQGRVLQLLVDAETGERGYIITGDSTYLEPYRGSVAQFPGIFQQLRSLTLGRPEQAARLDTLERLRNERLSIFMTAIERRATDFGSARQVVASAKEKQYTDAMRAIAARLDAAEQRVLAARIQRLHRVSAAAIVVAVLGFIASLASAFALNALFAGYEARARDAARSLQARETALQEQQELSRAILENMNDAVIAADRNGRLRFANRAAERLIPRDALEGGVEEIARRALVRTIDGHPLSAAEIPLARALRGESVADLPELFSHNGTARVLIANAQPIRDDGGELLGAVVVLRDETLARATTAALKQAESQLQQSQRLEAVGQLAGGVAHDFNNILTVILTTTDLALMDAALAAGPREEFERIHDAALHAAALTRQLLMLSRKQVVRSEVLDVCDVITRITPLLRRMLSEDIVLDLNMDDTCIVFADATQVEQVILNLALNARDAMPRGGTLRFEVRNARFEAPRPMQTGVLPPGSYAAIAVSDTGTGISPEVMAHLFEPFFTTKGSGGTGLGLATVLSIVAQYHGQIDVSSHIGTGSTFTIYMPLHDGVEHTSSDVSAGPEGDQHGSEAILLVEDEANVRAPLARALRELGYFVIEAKHGEDALTVLEEYAAPVHLVITDMVMPQMSGSELTRLLRSWYPGMRILFISGYSEELLESKGAMVLGARYLAKPFDLDTLSRTVREMLDE